MTCNIRKQTNILDILAWCMSGKKKHECFWLLSTTQYHGWSVLLFLKVKCKLPLFQAKLRISKMVHSTYMFQRWAILYFDILPWIPTEARRLGSDKEQCLLPCSYAAPLGWANIEPNFLKKVWFLCGVAWPSDSMFTNKTFVSFPSSIFLYWSHTFQ